MTSSEGRGFRSVPQKDGLTIYVHFLRPERREEGTQTLPRHRLLSDVWADHILNDVFHCRPAKGIVI